MGDPSRRILIEAHKEEVRVRADLWALGHLVRPQPDVTHFRGLPHSPHATPARASPDPLSPSPELYRTGTGRC